MTIAPARPLPSWASTMGRSSIRPRRAHETEVSWQGGPLPATGTTRRQPNAAHGAKSANGRPAACGRAWPKRRRITAWTTQTRDNPSGGDRKGVVQGKDGAVREKL